MSFLLAPDLVDFAHVLRRFFATELPSERLRRHVLSDVGPVSTESECAQLWNKVVDLGALSAVLPEDAGGLGFGPLAASVVLEESARALLPVPLFETVTFGVLQLLASEPSLAAANLLAEIASGDRKVTGAFGSSADFALSAKPLAGGEESVVAVSGTLRLVPSFKSVTSLLVPAKLSDGRTALCLIDRLGANADTFKSNPLQTFDLLRTFHEVILDGAQARVITELKKTCGALAEDLSLAAVAELCGCASRVVEMTAEYVKMRHQFGRPVGSFQAIQHKLADMLLVSEQAQSLCRFLAWCMTSDRAQAPAAAAAAKGYASEHIPRLCESAIQVHGGIGFTYEYDLHLYLRRALVLARGFQSAEASYLSLSEKFLHS
ncbi:MAG: acyl-CoA dehydrogenase family protein [Bdellovibrionota bacterium]